MEDVGGEPSQQEPGVVGAERLRSRRHAQGHRRLGAGTTQRAADAYRAGRRTILATAAFVAVATAVQGALGYGVVFATRLSQAGEWRHDSGGAKGQQEDESAEERSHWDAAFHL
jgi:hypothetical protein